MKIFTKRFISTARSLSKSNLTQSGTEPSARTGAGAGAGPVGPTAGENRGTAPAGEGARRSNGSYGLSEMSPGNRGSSHLKGKGWTMITADADSD